MKTEFEKMRSAELYYFTDPEIAKSLAHAKEACRRLNQFTLGAPGYREALDDLIPDVPESSSVCPPFHCDHGHGIRMGEGTFVNYDCIILDAALVTIGNHVLVGPKCQLVTPQHPKDFLLRRHPCETSYPITIGDDTWLGAGVIVCPGVTIGKRCIIGAGSVVIHDIPDDCMAAGNPAVVKKHLAGQQNLDGQWPDDGAARDESLPSDGTSFGLTSQGGTPAAPSSPDGTILGNTDNNESL
jgi:maltose O-acetyltransferase